MAVSREYLNYVLDQLAGIPGLSARAMFGGAGIYSDGRMFALVTDDCLYLKADTKNLPIFEAEGARPFTYRRSGKPVSLSYFLVPDEILEDDVRLKDWAWLAISAARRKPVKREKS
ncbi:TfoX/Sxy family protein [Aestuariispira ectoiniformans]|uniref:TfoX/Sxy family protein n=1 Tax=Aestuariispira ectoiniformans TaxID=2775080 RepID=UPI00223BE0D7|nr:TfoX/Sxy family protein [Aestuariispira ectoiniformans]